MKSCIKLLTLLLSFIILSCTVENTSYNVKDIKKEHFIIVSDTHLESPYGLELKLKDIPDTDNTIYIGDIFEITNARFEKSDIISDKASRLKNKVGNRYIRGNHEGYAFRSIPIDENKNVKIKFKNSEIIFTELDYLIRTVNNQKILFIHGHKGIDSDYDSKKINETENTKGGKGLVFQIFFPIGGWIRDHKSNTPNEEMIKNATHLAAIMDCQTIVFGHTHIKSIFDKRIKDIKTGKSIRIINVPRGVTHLEL